MHMTNSNVPDQQEAVCQDGCSWEGGMKIHTDVITTQDEFDAMMGEFMDLVAKAEPLYAAKR